MQDNVLQPLTFLLFSQTDSPFVTQQSSSSTCGAVCLNPLTSLVHFFKNEIEEGMGWVLPFEIRSFWNFLLTFQREARTFVQRGRAPPSPTNGCPARPVSLTPPRLRLPALLLPSHSLPHFLRPENGIFLRPLNKHVCFRSLASFPSLALTDVTPLKSRCSTTKGSKRGFSWDLF